MLALALSLPLRASAREECAGGAASCGGSSVGCPEEASLLQARGWQRARRGSQGPCTDDSSCAQGLVCVSKEDNTWAQCIDCRAGAFQDDCVSWDQGLLWPAETACGLTCEGYQLSYPRECVTREFSTDWPTDQCQQVAAGELDFACLTGGDTNQQHCGARVSSNGGHGAGEYSATIRAAPGDGMATTFYLMSGDLGPDFARDVPWTEVDFEILTKQDSDGSSTRAWTNMFVGMGTNAPEWITLPFSASGGYHEYTIDIGCCTMALVVDGHAYRTEDISYFPDMRRELNESTMKTHLSLWGQNKSSGNWGDMGYLEDNPHRDVVSSYRSLSQVHSTTASCPMRNAGPLAATKKGFDGWEMFFTNASAAFYEQLEGLVIDRPPPGPPGTSLAGFTLVGNGACRTADGGSGDFQLASVQSPEQCHNMCLESSWCVAYETSNTDYQRCELHREAVARVANEGCCQCWARDWGSPAQPLPTPPPTPAWGSEGGVTLTTAFYRSVWAGAGGGVLVGDGGASSASAASDGCWATFRFTPVGGGRAAVQTCDDSYLTVKSDGSVVAEAAAGPGGETDACQQFLVGQSTDIPRFVEAPAGSFFLKSCLDTYLTEARQEAC